MLLEVYDFYISKVFCTHTYGGGSICMYLKHGILLPFQGKSREVSFQDILKIFFHHFMEILPKIKYAELIHFFVQLWKIGLERFSVSSHHLLSAYDTQGTEPGASHLLCHLISLHPMSCIFNLLVNKQTQSLLLAQGNISED